MNARTLTWAFVIGALYVTWPIVGKRTGASTAWITNMVVLGTLFMTAALSNKQLTHGPGCAWKVIGVLIFAGCLNGFAVYFYSKNVNDPAVPSGVFLITVYIFMVILAPILDWILNGTTLTLRQCCGVGVVLGGIWLMKKPAVI